MDKTSPLDCYLYYMWNRWDAYENDRVFGESASEPSLNPVTGKMVIGGPWADCNHFWNKWYRINQKYGAGAPAVFYSELSAGNRRKIVEAALNYYNI